MYQTFNPYTGEGTINLAPSMYSTLGLGQDALLSQVGFDKQHPILRAYRNHPKLRTAIASKFPNVAKVAARLGPGIESIPPNVFFGNAMPAATLSGLGDATVDTSSTDFSLSDQFASDTAFLNNLLSPTMPATLPSGERIDYTTDPSAVPYGAISSDISSGTSAAAGIATSLLSDANSIAKIVLTPGGSYSITNPLTGQVTTYQGTGQPSAVPGSSILTNLVGSASSSMWILLGVGLVVFMMMEKK